MPRSTFWIRLFILVAWVALISGSLYLSAFKKSPNEEKTVLNIYGWPDTFLPDAIHEFEKETGVQVKRHFYTSNEELLVTLRANKGKGYDLIIPSDYAVKMLIEEDLLSPLNHSKCTFLPDLNPTLLNKHFDPKNRYSIPYQWEIYGFGIDQDYFEKQNLKINWDLLFSPKEIKLAMVNDPIEAFNFASYYLFGPQTFLDAKKVRKIRDLLEKQKKGVEAYAGVRADYLLATKNCHAALCSSSYIFRSSAQYPHIKFVVPGDWTMVTIENICIPKKSKKQELVYELLNHLYKPENMANDAARFCSFPATTNTRPYLKNVPPDFLTLLEEKTPCHLFFAEHLIPEKAIRQIWVDVKS